MVATTLETATGGSKIERSFSGKRQAALLEPGDDISEESQAALRQLSIERLMAYGVHHPDAMELRGRVRSGEAWQVVATELAETCLFPPERNISSETKATRINRLFRASALLRMSQMMMLQNSTERSEIFARAGTLYEEGATLLGDRSRMNIDTANGRLTGWLYPGATAKTIGRVVIIGGVEGWAMDFADFGHILASRGIETLVLDGPGQGESRMVCGHYLRPGWERSYADVFDALERLTPKLPIGIIGNSLGGSFAIHLAARDTRIVACCNNGGTSVPVLARSMPTFFQKMSAFVGDVSADEAAAVWKTVTPVDPAMPIRCPLLVVHGSADPLVTEKDAENMFRQAASVDKHMVVFSDGDHCIYNHTDDKHALIGDWMASRLVNA